MDKVKITQEQADAIDEMFRQGVNSRHKIIELHVNDPYGWTDHCVPLNNMTLDELITAIYIGYEVEETPEDKVKSFYDNASEKKSDLLSCAMVSYDEVELQNGIMRGIEGTLNRLNIKIEGIN